ncbi:hypothetical protein [Kribbella caucasensis]|uniref:hypothetical protein n=1 Tax=Kribbella caucasensis TaxID=2512215 RepID=UPI00105E0A56|nr:hypothetical protein [Kribbella sp. VKM Ac-2527]
MLELHGLWLMRNDRDIHEMLAGLEPNQLGEAGRWSVWPPAVCRQGLRSGGSGSPCSAATCVATSMVTPNCTVDPYDWTFRAYQMASRSRTDAPGPVRAS